MTTATYTINLTDSEQTPAWMALCATATPGAQDSGRVRYTVTTEQPDALEAALDADDDVLEYERERAIEYRCEECGELAMVGTDEAAYCEAHPSAVIMSCPVGA